MKRLFALLLLAGTLAANAQTTAATHVQAVPASLRMTLNDGWTFEGRPVSIPHTWNTDAYTVKDYRKGTFTYERDVTFPSDGKRKYLRFDAAFKVADVWLNDVHLGQHRGGYTAFAFDVTPYVREGRNRLKVMVSNLDETVPPISADFTFMGGLYRDVWLIEKSQQHFDVMDGLRVTADSAQIAVSLRLRNADAKAQSCVVGLRLMDAEGRVLRATSKKVRLAGQELASPRTQRTPRSPRTQRTPRTPRTPTSPSNQAPASADLTQTLPIPSDARLWTPETPYLYTLEATLYAKDGKTPLDRQTQPVAIRWYAFDGDRGFTLNDQPYKLHGVCIHQDQKPYGIALDDDQHRRDFRLMKDMGVNFVRLAHYPQDDALLEMCDREGMLVWEEIPVVDIVPAGDAFADNCREQLREMIRQHASHPSVILWGYMNEILLQTQRRYRGAALDTVVARTLDLARSLEQIVHQEDATRLSAMAFHGSDDYNKLGLGDIPQVVGWNLYQGWYGSDMRDFERYLERQHQQHPSHPIIVSEYGAGSDLRLHNPRGGQAFDFSMEYQQRYVEHYLPVIEQTPYVSGGAYWNFIDFASANRDESMPRINNKGLVAADRTPKDIYYYCQALWQRDRRPVLHIATRDWPNRLVDSRQMPVKVYTNAPQVELRLNGKSLGRKAVDNCLATFEADFVEGGNILEAITDAGRDVAKVTVVTSSDNGISVNVGSDCHYQSEASGATWLPDRPYTPGGFGYIGGKAAQTQTQIQLTEDNPLYQTRRDDLQAFRFDVADGTYEVELLMADVRQHQQSSAYLLGREDSQQEGSGGFQISINGRVVESDFVPAAKFSAVRRRYIVSQSEGHVVVEFSPGAYLSAIRLRRI